MHVLSHWGNKIHVSPCFWKQMQVVYFETKIISEDYLTHDGIFYILILSIKMCSCMYELAIFKTSQLIEIAYFYAPSHLFTL